MDIPDADRANPVQSWEYSDFGRVGPIVEEATDGRARPAVDFTVARSGLNAGACFSA